MKKLLKPCLIALLVLLVLACAAGGYVAYAVHNARYRSTDNSLYTASDFLKNKEVMVVVPHQDDDLNVASAMIANYLEAGSHVKLVFSTNGDYYGKGEERIAEALKVASLYGIPKEDVILLGYGDTGGAPYLYEAGWDAVVASVSGHTETYGLCGIEDFRTSVSGAPSAYTKRNFFSDLYDLIDLNRPDVLIVTDLDPHRNHRMLSLAFDAVMGQMLKAEPGYRPLVLKALAYDAVWRADEDVYSLPLKSTLKPDDYDRDVSAPYFRWSDRARFPVPQGFRAYTQQASPLHALLAAYASQNADTKQSRMQSGDQVYWVREVTSLSYSATIEASSGDASALNDFMLGDMSNLNNESFLCDKGQWLPDADDAEPTVTFLWSEPQTIGRVVLYDSADPDDGVTEVTLAFDEGEPLTVTDIDGGGAATTIMLPQPVRASRATLRVTQRQGNKTGLCEAEFYAPEARETQLIKLTTAEDDFAYELELTAGQTSEMKLYAWPALNADAPIELTLESESGAQVAGAAYDPHTGAISLPAMDAGTYSLRAQTEDGALYDQCWLVVGDGQGRWQRFLQRIDRAMVNRGLDW